MRVETDLESIRQLAEERKDENWEFRTFLKQCDEDDVDARVHRILDEVNAQVDCTACGNCCTVIWPKISDADIERLAECLYMTPEGFRAQYIMKDEDGDIVLRGQPCPFLEDKRCTVYPNRPENCRSYPHLHKEWFNSRLISVISNYAVCPIVFNVYERLKDEIWSRRRRRR